MTNKRHGLGTVEWRRGRWYARVSVPGKGRPRLELATPDGRRLTDREADRQLAIEYASSLSTQIRAMTMDERAKLTGALVAMSKGGEQGQSLTEVLRALLTEVVRDAVADALADLERPEQAPALLTTEQLAHALQCSTSWVHKARKQQGLPFVMLGDSPRFVLAEVIDWVRLCSSETRVENLPERLRRLIPKSMGGTGAERSGRRLKR